MSYEKPRNKLFQVISQETYEKAFKLLEQRRAEHRGLEGRITYRDDELLMLLLCEQLQLNTDVRFEHELRGDS